MTVNLGIPAESPTVQLPAARQMTAMVSSSGVQDSAAFARQQLPSAVPAPVQVAAGSPQLPQFFKQVARTPSSPLAAQFIAQGAITEDGGFALFEPDAQQPATPVENDSDAEFLATMRMGQGAPGIAAQASKPSAPNPATRAASVPSAALGQPGTPDAADARLGNGGQKLQQSAPIQFMLPVVTQFAHSPSLTHARGFASYQMSVNRNAGIKSKAVRAEPTQD